VSVLRLPPLQVGRDGARWRAEAKVRRHRVTFDSSHPLTAAAEALPSAFLLPAMVRGADVEVSEPVCPDWLANVDTVRVLAGDWWRYTGGRVRGPAGTSDKPAADTALFFGGGVDSFFSLVTKDADIRYLIYVQGFDVLLADRARLERVDAWNRRVAAETGKELTTVRTNLRGIPAFRMECWENAHPGALAAVGHLLSGLAGRFLLPSSIPVWLDWTFGSTPAMDPAWSSSRMHIDSHGKDHDRDGKVRGIAHSPLAHRYLRVCWQSPDEGLNCGECEKSVRTQLEFMAAGTLDQVRTFPRGPMAARVDALPGLPESYERYYQQVLDEVDDRPLRAAIQALIDRSPAWQRKQARRKRFADAARYLRWRFQ